MSDRYLTDERWTAVASILPGKDGDPGCSGRDNRLFLEAVFWIARTEQPWRNLPKEFGKWYTTYTRFHRWTRKGVWPRVLDAMTQDGFCDFTIDQHGLRWMPMRATASEARSETDARVAA